MLQPDDTPPDWNTPLDQTTPKQPDHVPFPSDGIGVLASAVAILAGVLVILLIVSAMIGAN